MKKFFTLLFLSASFISFAQSPIGLVAHWKMNGNALDATGNGHNGTLYNVTPAPGQYGNANTALYFNGNGNSFMSVPYQSDLNIQVYSICAIVKVASFYTGPCQANTILMKGITATQGSYSLRFGDNPFDSSCYTHDTSKNVFLGYAGTLPPATNKAWQYSPAIVSNTWYAVVVTYDAASFKVYVNGVKMSTNYTPGGYIGASANNDSLVIGMDRGNVAQYPYPFTGAIDDIMLYNRVLGDSEIVKYNNVSLGVNEVNTNKLAYSVTPNPAKEFIKLQLGNNSSNQLTTITLINQIGQVVKHEVFTGNQEQINVSNLPKGMYFLQLMNKDGNATSKVTIE